MFIFLLNKILYFTDNDVEFYRRMRENAEEVVRSFPLGGDELEALVTGDVVSRITFDTGMGVRPP